VERTLIEQGNAEAVHSIRRSFQDAMEGPFTSLVEAATGRKVIAYMSQVHEAAEIAAELFVLEPSEQAVVQAGEQELHGGEELAT